ncbi:tRNA/rRNA methyltransferase, SpoU [Corchorus capsularis]|uniref:tRNA/rRNA methyltransferase, SpoU n=1 Tax=Corchorus capsularis TaxID=210143 RepID=A0A1R3IYS7_COCAP|nr:tRNA/rRNA methyltransferase, SpoU [Corchorus capsularis]
MSACKSIIHTSLSTLRCKSKLDFNSKPFCLPFFARPISSVPLCSGIDSSRIQTRSFSAVQQAIPLEDESLEDFAKDTVERLLTDQDDMARLMKMERKSVLEEQSNRWFPYLDRFRCGSEYLSSREVLEAVGPYLMEERKERLKRVVRNRSYSVCLVVEGLSDFGNVSATFRSADALGLQSVHVVSCDSSKRYRENRHVSMGAEKWLDIELWNSPKECFEILKSRGYRIATTHVGMDAVSIYDMDWSSPTAIVVGNENRGISEEALGLSDLHCSIPMKGMVDSFNVSVAAGIVMHHAVCDRTTRLGCHGDLNEEESQILMAEFLLRHNNSSISIANEYARRKASMTMPRL